MEKETQKKSTSIFSSFSQNFNKIFNFSNISCNNSDTVKKGDKENNITTILRNDPNLCPQHLRDRTHFCKDCQSSLCFVCASDHISLKHEVFEYSELGNFIKKRIQAVFNRIDSGEMSMNENEFSDFKAEIENGLGQIKEAKEDLISMIELYFENLEFKFLELFKRIPSVYQVQDMKNSIKLMKNDVSQFEKLTVSTKKPDLSEIKRFLNQDFEEKVRGKLNEYEILKEMKNSNKRINVPNIQISKPFIEQIFNTIPNYCNAIPSTDSYYDQLKKIRVQTPNYFLPEFESCLPFIDDLTEKLHLYNIGKERCESYNLTVNCEIPADHTILVTPNMDVFISGGILKNGELSNQTFQCSPFTDFQNDEIQESFQVGLPLKEKAKMFEKKVAHSLCYVKNKIFCIGGKINNSDRTKKCEKYDVATNKWIEIAPLNHERTRPAITSFEDRFIYVFYGCDNVDSCKTIEKYDINLDKWLLIKAYNQWPQFEVSFGSAIQINNNQILVFGGFYEGAQHNNKKEMIFNDRGLLFNVNENNFINLGSVMPINYCQSYAPVAINNNIYSLGYVVRAFSPNFNRYMDADFVLKIENGNIQCKDVFYYK